MLFCGGMAAPAMVLDEFAPTHLERPEIRISRIENGCKFIVRALDITTEIQCVEVPFRILEHNVGEERICEECAPCQLVSASPRDPSLPIGGYRFGAGREARGDLRACFGVFRGAVDFSRRLDLRRRQAAGTISPLAQDHNRIEAAKPWILD